jgi:acetyltransferase
MVKVSYLLVDFPEILEMDVNPLQVRPDGLCALDARIVIEPKSVRKITQPGSHLIIPMYPSKYHWEIPVDGDTATIRAIRPEDEPLWAEMIESLSPDTAEYRFFGSVKEVTKAMLVRYCHVDYDREIALAVVTKPTDGRAPQMIGVGRLTLDSADAKEGEFAILVRDDYQRKGIGTKLTNALIEVARDRHVEEIYGDVLAENPAMEPFVGSLGFEIRTGREIHLRTIVLKL